MILPTLFIHTPYIIKLALSFITYGNMLNSYYKFTLLFFHRSIMNVDQNIKGVWGERFVDGLTTCKSPLTSALDDLRCILFTRKFFSLYDGRG